MAHSLLLRRKMSVVARRAHGVSFVMLSLTCPPEPSGAPECTAEQLHKQRAPKKSQLRANAQYAARCALYVVV